MAFGATPDIFSPDSGWGGGIYDVGTLTVTTTDTDPAVVMSWALFSVPGLAAAQ